ERHDLFGGNAELGLFEKAFEELLESVLPGSSGEVLSSDARLGNSISMSLWVCRVRLKPAALLGSPGLCWAADNAGVRIDTAQAVAASVDPARRSVISINVKPNPKPTTEDALGGKRFGRQVPWAPRPGGWV